MKKLLFSIVALVTFGFANAQLKEEGALEITPKIGISTFWEYNDYQKATTDSHTGAELGITGDYYFNNRWSLRSGLLFQKMGGEEFYNNALYVDKFNYLSIPLNANWHFGKTRNWNLNFGFSPSFLLNANVNGEEYPEGVLEKVQLGLSYGIGYKIPVNEKFGILIDLQSFYGLTNINNTSDVKFTNNGGSINVGGVFQL